MNKPIQLTAERAWRTYLGGSEIDRLHGNESGEDNHFPEEWIMSITSCRNAGREHIVNEGMSRVKGSHPEVFLKDIIERDPEATLGEGHYAKFGKTTGVLVKIIDSAERLSIQVHPNKRTAKEYFASDYGKTESWHILGGRTVNGEPPCIYLGFKEGVTKDRWKRVFDEQNIPEMLDCLNKIEVKAGDTFLIKGGVPHAIGAGCFLIEVQEPTDYTVRTERTTPSGFRIADVMCHQGIGFDKMFEIFDYEGCDLAETLEKYKLKSKTVGNEQVHIDYNDTDCFSLTEVKVNDTYTFVPEDTYFGIYVTEGHGSLVSVDGEVVRLYPTAQFFVPAGAGFKVRAEKPLKIMKFRGPKI